MRDKLWTTALLLGATAVLASAGIELGRALAQLRALAADLAPARVSAPSLPNRPPPALAWSAASTVVAAAPHAITAPPAVVPEPGAESRGPPPRTQIVEVSPHDGDRDVYDANRALHMAMELDPEIAELANDPDPAVRDAVTRIFSADRAD